MADRKSDPSKPGIGLDDAVAEVQLLVDDAIDFRATELEPDWAVAERYYNGYCDLEEFEGRSNVTKTEVRDAIKNTMPSIMRVLTHAHKIVGFLPSSVHHAAWVDQQAEYATYLFYANNGYQELYHSILEALKLKNGVMQAFWEPDPLPEYFSYTKVPFAFVQGLIDDEMVEVTDYDVSESDTPQLGSTPHSAEEEEGLGSNDLYDVEGYKYHENGKIVIEAVPNYEFFISDNCDSIEDAILRGVHGISTVISVAEAIDMGLDYDAWDELDADDPELDEFTTSSTERRGYTKSEPNDPDSTDVLNHKFLYTKAIVRYDLKGTGRPQLYSFHLGGSSRVYIDHEEIDDSPYSLIVPLPIPHSAIGHSIADFTINEQDTSTSILRATVDNAHVTNNARFAADPSKTNFDDLMNPALNAPIRKRTGDTLQIVQVPSTVQSNMALLQYLDMDVQQKVGVTKAAQGLDPDALQSTDKDAVRNTIMTAQGQTELIVRNIIEFGLIRLFKRILKLSIQHQAPRQIMLTKGKVIPVDLRMFDPDAVAYPMVGLGTASPEQKQAALSMVLQRQEVYMDKFGPNNPFTSMAQIYNTVEDLLEANGIYDAGRYFNIVTPNVEAEWAKAQAEQAKAQQEKAEQNAPMDPSKAFLQVEAQKRQVEASKAMMDQRDRERDRSLRALEAAERNDIERDKLVQTRVIELSRISAQSENEKVKREQQANDEKSTSKLKKAANTSNSSDTATQTSASNQ